MKVIMDKSKPNIEVIYMGEFEKTIKTWASIGEHMKKKHPNARYFGTYPDLEDGGDRCQLCGEKL